MPFLQAFIFLWQLRSDDFLFETRTRGLDRSPWVRTTHPVVWSPVDNLFWKLISIVAILLIYYQNIAFPREELKTKEICFLFKAVIFQIFVRVYACQKAAERFCITPTR